MAAGHDAPAAPYGTVGGGGRGKAAYRRTGLARDIATDGNLRREYSANAKLSANVAKCVYYAYVVVAFHCHTGHTGAIPAHWSATGPR